MMNNLIQFDTPPNTICIQITLTFNGKHVVGWRTNIIQRIIRRC